MPRLSMRGGAELTVGASRRLSPYASKWRSNLVLHERVHSDWPAASTQMPRLSVGGGAELPAGASRYQCRLCPYASKWRSSLVVHERVHTGERPFRCHLCSRAFAGRTDMVRHLRTHTGERPFQCPLCPATFSQRGNARVHLRLHGRSTPVARRNRLAHSAFDRTRHSSPHVVGPPASTQMPRLTVGGGGAGSSARALRHQCRLCPYESRWRSSLVQHERVHTGERPFRCHLCNRGFVHRSHVVRHLRTHTGERPFRCPLCPATFAQRSNVKVHLRSHVPQDSGNHCAQGAKISRVMQQAAEHVSTSR
ncbi:zinc finger protein 2-like [Dermacentor albipictus]|uniref:zinc finger protein 2-like n=1 Tax=Dermacentor albipictus TaxID=60249 RepID=UPI0031FD06FC